MKGRKKSVSDHRQLPMDFDATVKSGTWRYNEPAGVSSLSDRRTLKKQKHNETTLSRLMNFARRLP